MRHLKHRHQLGRKKEHRSALMSNLAAALLTHGRIKTTLPKAKALRPFVEKIITLAKKAQTATPERALAYRRLAIARVRDTEAVATLFNKRATEFVDRNGGYTRIYKLGVRVGDAAEMAVIQLIPAADEGYAKKGRSTRKTPVKAVEDTPAETVVADPVEEVSAEATEAASAEETGEEKKES
ncbi:MAG: 50S ribosomal protein L17 [Verrucomicrobia bacterium]|nr:50S ribosomal protein L17 [Verrucomicrobiota bacterium]